MIIAAISKGLKAGLSGTAARIGFTSAQSIQPETLHNQQWLALQLNSRPELDS
jgi:hypothetical protein